jgi:MFS family permease
MVMLSAIEGIGVAIAYPAYTALLVQVGPEAVRGRVIGCISTIRTIGVLTASFVVPGIYARDPALCFGLTSIVLVGGVLWLAVGLILDTRSGHRQPMAKPLLAVRPLAGSGEGP